MSWRPSAVLILLLLLAGFARAADRGISGQLTDTQGKPVAGARVRLKAASETKGIEAVTDADGKFEFPPLAAGNYEISATAPGFAETKKTVGVGDSEALNIGLRFTRLATRTESLNVTTGFGQLDIQHPDPAQQTHVRDDLLDANPGHPGAPVSIPGFPAETASSGIKAPQYFAPGVAGDHGEPIAQFFQVGSYLVPNNLSANAHGNGYSDPNVIVPPIIESVQTDGGSFNVREGDHSVNLSATYGFRERVQPFVTLTGDHRDFDMLAGWSPANSETRSWFVVQASYGNGFLDTLEHRQQYKINGFRIFVVGRHEITLFGIGYYGQSRIPGLVPIDVANLRDTIDPRQRDQTHTGEIVLNDVWRLTKSSELQLSGFFRTYNLSLYSNFGDGLIRQSEFRTVTGANGTYIHKFHRYLSVMFGADYFREAPRRLDLDHYESADLAIYGPFQKVTANNVTMNSLTPYVAINGQLTRWLSYNLGWRRDEIDFENSDLLVPANSYQRWAGVNSPKATISILPREQTVLPSVSVSFGQSFFTNDPRTWTGTAPVTPVSRAHAYQMVVSKTILSTDVRVTLGRITQEQSLAKIDPDTGLQFNEGPSRNRYVTVTARRYFRGGWLQASVSKADSRSMSDGHPVPEAPRVIVDFLGTLDRLPFQLHGRAEFEEVGRKPLGDGFFGVPVREFRGALVRQFGGRIQASINFQLSKGYTGQTTEVLALTGEAQPAERVTGVYLPSYATVSFTYRFGRAKQP